ncbi:MAG: uncharacterized protein JWO37_3388 [Acidimicrobiales bacterium]|jgi:cytochrome c oxidase assembly protein subunit 15|nr:uncharacterized protein [Acidimicrobiales bacterium]
MRRLALSADAYRRITLLALIAVAVIIVTGGAVRLTGSGLGCPDWPTCSRGSLVQATSAHRAIESINRTFTGLVSVAVALAVLGSLRRRGPRRRDLVWLSVGLVGGVIGQIILGGLTVLFDLAPPLVMGHFLLSMALLADAVVLYERAGRPDPPVTVRPVVDVDTRRVGDLLVAAAALVVFLGTVVTAAGPHGGDEHVRRLDIPLHRVAQFHGAAVMLFLAMTLTMVWLLRRAGAPAEPMRRVRALLVVLIAQAAVGYIQYFNGVPVVLVGIHIAGAAAVWVAVLRLRLALSRVLAEPARMEAWAASSRPSASPPPRSASPHPTSS